MKVEFDITDVGALIESPVGMMHVSKAADIMGIDEDLLRSMCSAAIIPAVRRENDQNNLFINCRQLNRMLDADAVIIRSPRKVKRELKAAEAAQGESHV